jgi:hypothetical protein
MKNIKLLIFGIPLLVFADMYSLSWIAEFLRERSDVAVFVGVVMLTLLIASHVYLFNYLYNQFKPKTK